MHLKYTVLMSIYYKENPLYFKESLLSILNQTVRPDEIVIVQDGPLTDKLESILNEFRKYNYVKIIELKENVGLGRALNIGMEHCSNELVARMDTDDIACPDRFEQQLKVFIENKNVDIVGSFVAEFEENIENISSMKCVPLSDSKIKKFAKRRNPFNHPTVMYKRSSVINVGGYKHFNFFEDYYLWIRMINDGAVCVNIGEPLVFMRANKGLFKRRGGIKYIICIIRFRWYLYSSSYSSILDFIIATTSQCIVALLPNDMRIFIYKKFLRREDVHNVESY